MKKIYYLPLLLLLVSLQTVAQPTRNWLSYYSGEFTNIYNIVYDKAGDCIYVTGSTADSTGITTPGSYIAHFSPKFAFDIINCDKALFLAKFDLLGNRIWGTYVDTSHHYNDAANISIKTDRSGNIYLATIADTGMASPGASIVHSRGGILYKFSSNGFQQWATYIGKLDTLIYNQPGYPNVGLVVSYGNGGINIDIDSSRNVYITTSANTRYGIATPGAYQDSLNGVTAFLAANDPYSTMPSDGILLKYDSNGIKQWGTYFGGSKNDVPFDLWHSSGGFIYITGNTESTDGFGTPGVYQSQPPANMSDIFKTSFLNKFTSDGQLVWSTYIGGVDSALIYASRITGDDAGNVYLYGGTSSLVSIATPGTLMDTMAGPNELFLMKFSSQGQRIWGTYFGGTGDEPYRFEGNFRVSLGIHYSPNNNSLFIGGITEQINNLVSECSYRTLGTTYGFLAKIDTSGQLNWAAHYDAGVTDMTIKDNDNGDPTELFITGNTNLNGLATPNAFLDTKVTPRSGFIGRFGDFYDCSIDTLHISWNAPWLVADTGYNNYQWYHNNNLVSNVDSSAFMPIDTTGIYYLKAEKCGCKHITDPIDFGTPTGIININNQNAFLKIYPNPAQQQINISIPSNMHKPEGLLQVVSTLGTVIEEIPMKFDYKNQALFDVSFLPNAVYGLRLITGKQVYNGKFVKK